MKTLISFDSKDLLQTCSKKNKKRKTIHRTTTKCIAPLGEISFALPHSTTYAFSLVCCFFSIFKTKGSSVLWSMNQSLNVKTATWWHSVVLASTSFSQTLQPGSLSHFSSLTVCSISWGSRQLGWDERGLVSHSSLLPHCFFHFPVSRGLQMFATALVLFWMDTIDTIGKVASWRFMKQGFGMLSWEFSPS